MKFQLFLFLLCRFLQNLTLSHLQVLPFMQPGHMMGKKLLLIRLYFNQHFSLS
jgi:hypothetical protein